MTPELSVITVNLNNLKGLEQTIGSVLKQTFSNFEFLVIDGASTDGSRELLTTYSSQINYWVSEKDDGIYHAMNKGIAQAKGTYCLFLNSGDWLVDPNVLHSCFKQSPKADLLIGGCRVSKDQQTIFTSHPDANLSMWSFYQKTIPHQSTFIRKALFERLGPYLESYRIHGDYEFWIRAIILHHCSVEALPYIVADYNLEGLSSDSHYQEQSQKEVRQILQQTFPERILCDYEYWKQQESDIRLMQWLKSKRLLYQFNKLFYSFPTRWASFKKAYGA